MTIRIDAKAKAALEIVAAEQTAVRGENVTLSEAIWYLVEEGAEHVAKQVEQLTKSTTQSRRKSAK